MEGMTDPVCGMEIESKEFDSQHMEMNYNSCSTECKAAFDKNPMQFMKGHQGHCMHEHGGYGCC